MTGLGHRGTNNWQKWTIYLSVNRIFQILSKKHVCNLSFLYQSTLCNFKKIQCSQYLLANNLIEVLGALDFLEVRNVNLYQKSKNKCPLNWLVSKILTLRQLDEYQIARMPANCPYFCPPMTGTSQKYISGLKLCLSMPTIHQLNVAYLKSLGLTRLSLTLFDLHGVIVFFEVFCMQVTQSVTCACALVHTQWLHSLSKFHPHLIFPCCIFCTCASVTHFYILPKLPSLIDE